MFRRRVLILSTSAGTGHLRAAEALGKVFRRQPETDEVLTLDALKFTNKIFRDFYSSLYIQLVEKAPAFLGWWYKMTDEPWKTDRMRLMLDRLNTGPLVEFLESYAPDITVCTHFLPAELISHLISQARLRTRLSIVVTDFHFHAMWLCRLFHRYFVATEETRVHLSRLGLPEERITVSGIPIDPVFSVPLARSDARRALGVDPHLPLLLVSAGALGVGPAEVVVESLRSLSTLVQIVVICGKNPSLRERLLKTKAEWRASSPLKVFGYTQEMHRWMAAADLLIGKPGGLTASEAMARGLPMVIVAPIPGQEELNSDYLLEQGAAVKCHEFTTLAYKVDSLLGNPSRLQVMRTAARNAAHPNAAQIIVRRLLEDEAQEPEPIWINRKQKEQIAQAAKAVRL
ncbi:Galactosyldiacylglycerol synthase [Methylacidimicrobium sp. AP8]|uniref:MGDG synthase family glycosyltransferase n=1 Tax=Methylacidimicrobium sp. AP8 TaxID=2730359 RepID=UPI0018C0C63A|nr:glycosyltransferase [Methylacidimicrobium sp. AP8]CAB4243420.1 Galactosyldiacylglycerol synthase [Methylacidimicrobium sp. AP8]